MLIPLIVHERRDHWGRHIRPRAGELSARVVETRSAADLLRAVAGTASSVIVLALGSRPAEGLELLDRVMQAAPESRVVVLDTTGDPALGRLARELGALHVLPADTRPPELLELLARWTRQATARTATAGWIAPPDRPLDPVDALLATVL